MSQLREGQVIIVKSNPTVWSSGSNPVCEEFGVEAFECPLSLDYPKPFTVKLVDKRQIVLQCMVTDKLYGFSLNSLEAKDGFRFWRGEAKYYNYKIIKLGIENIIKKELGL